MIEAASDLPDGAAQPVQDRPTRASVIRARVIPAVALTMVLALLGLLAWSLFAPDNTRSAQRGRINRSGAVILDDRRPAGDFTVTTFDGAEFTLSEQRGKIVIINFWGSWCPPCREETPLLTTVANRLGDDVILIGIDMQDTESAARDFLETYDVNYPTAPDTDGKIAIDYGVTGAPETFVVDAQGRIAAKLLGPVTSVEQLREMVDAAR